MPRVGWRKPVSGRRMSDLISIGLLTRVFPAGVVDEVIAVAGRTEQRCRTLPARVVAYFTLAMALHADGSYEDVFADLTDGLSWAGGWEDEYPIPSASAIFQARVRLGAAPLQALFRRVAVPLARPQWQGSWLCGRRLLAIDGTTLQVADTAANEEAFGRPGAPRGERAAFPQARLVAVAECGTHAILDAAVGRYGDGEQTLAAELLDRLGPGVVLMADRGFYGFGYWQRAAATGADLLWRVKKHIKPTLVETLEDGTWIGEIRQSRGTGWRQSTPMRVRVIDYEVSAEGMEGKSEKYRLLTTLVDPKQAPAVELMAAYRNRWEIESVFDEFKTHQRGAGQVLRSKSGELVVQELWGYLCTHYAIRVLMADTATYAGQDPGRVSFVKALNHCRRSVTQGNFFP